MRELYDENTKKSDQNYEILLIQNEIENQLWM